MSTIDIYSDGYSSGTRHRKVFFSGKAVIFILLLLLGIVGLEIFSQLVFAPAVSIKKVEVAVSPELGMTEAEISELSGVKGGESFYDVDPAEIEDRLMSFAPISKAVVRKKFPATIVMTVTGRQPFAHSFIMSGGISVPVTMDKEGVIYQIGNTNFDSRLPVVSGFDFDEIQLGARLPETIIPYFSRLEAVREAVPVLFNQISEIKFDRRKDDLFDVVLYPANSNIRIRTNLDMDEALLRKIFTVLDVVEKNGMLGKTDELDFRTGRVIYRVKEK
ncbi:MAG: FtsQ-type POTRA domain-containing protein [Spirochaetia bacterium]|nr:FtsQ-type POTRA domain-containing protein [Spirochaetia bacterium]